MTITIKNGWLTDDNGNRASVAHFGTEDAARKALESLVDCLNCVNCLNCEGCSYCTGCTNCSDCAYCSSCSGCAGCSGCMDCSSCSGCAGCRNCAGCLDKSGVRYKTGDFVPPIPTIEHIHQRVYEEASQPGALNMGAWHACDTTHCRAGWVVHLAGAPGYALEEMFGPPLAAQMIYRESGYRINPALFFTDNETAMADMKRLAEATP